MRRTRGDIRGDRVSVTSMTARRSHNALPVIRILDAHSPARQLVRALRWSAEKQPTQERLRAACCVSAK